MVPEDQRPSTPDRGLTERVADADRDRTVTLLREHVVEGRLTLDEFSERMGAALEAKTRGELDAVMADLPTTGSVPTASPTTATPRKTSRWHIAVMSGHSTRGRWRIGAKTKAVAVMGGCDMDLRRAEIEGPEVEITAFAFWGGIEIIVPEGFDVELRGFSFMGGRSLRLRDVPIVPGLAKDHRPGLRRHGRHRGEEPPQSIGEASRRFDVEHGPRRPRRSSRVHAGCAQCCGRRDSRRPRRPCRARAPDPPRAARAASRVQACRSSAAPGRLRRCRGTSGAASPSGSTFFDLDLYTLFHSDPFVGACDVRGVGRPSSTAECWDRDDLVLRHGRLRGDDRALR